MTTAEALERLEALEAAALAVLSGRPSEHASTVLGYTAGIRTGLFVGVSNSHDREILLNSAGTWIDAYVGRHA